MMRQLQLDSARRCVANMDEKPTVVVDTREQRPWTFDGLEVVRRALRTGDYSVVGLEHQCQDAEVVRGSLYSLHHSGHAGAERDNQPEVHSHDCEEGPQWDYVRHP